MKKRRRGKGCGGEKRHAGKGAGASGKAGFAVASPVAAFLLMSQLESQLRKHRFQPERHVSALYAPPSHNAYWLKSARFWEGLGKRLDSRMVAGALLVEATKQIYATPKSGLREAVKGPLGVLEGLAKPKPKPAANRTGNGFADRVEL